MAAARKAFPSWCDMETNEDADAVSSVADTEPAEHIDPQIALNQAIYATGDYTLLNEDT